MEKRIWYLCTGVSDTKVKLGPTSISHMNGEGRKELYHYTSVEPLLKIMDDARLKFTRIDKVDDLLEKNPLSEYGFYKRTYIACFSYNPIESIPLWKMYTSQGMGVRIGLSFKDKYIQKSIIDINRNIINANYSDVSFIKLGMGPVKSGIYLTVQDVIYSSNAYTNCFIKVEDNKIDFSPDDFGIYKSPYWDFEEETRLVMHVLSDEFDNVDTNFLLVPINISALDHIEIRFDPWMSKEMKACLKLTVNEFTKTWEVRIDFSDSDLTGKIR